MTDREKPHAPPASFVPLYAQQRMSVLLLVGASMVTMGLAVPAWFLLRREFLESLEGRVRLGRLESVLAMILLGVGSFSKMLDTVTHDPAQLASTRWLVPYAEDLARVAAPFGVVATIMVVVLSVRAHRAIDAHLKAIGRDEPLRMALSVLLGPVYLQYRLNLLAA